MFSSLIKKSTAIVLNKRRTYISYLIKHDNHNFKSNIQRYFKKTKKCNKENTSVRRNPFDFPLP